MKASFSFRRQDNTMRTRSDRFSLGEYIIFTAVTFAVLCLCVCIGSVNIPLPETLTVLRNGAGRLLRSVFTGTKYVRPEGTVAAILLSRRLPRVLCVSMTGAALSLAGGAMQGLLKNPLADGSTLGVSSGAALGAVTAIAFGITFPVLPFAGTMVMAIIFAFLSMLLILSLAYRLDSSLSTATIILIGVIFSMFVSSLMSIIITFAGDRIQHITFWTMGSLQSASWQSAGLLLGALILFGGAVFWHARELNAFAVGEDNARHIGVDVRRVRLIVLIAVSGLIGVCVSIGGTIAFVGLVTPHMVRMLAGPNHKRLLPASLFGGAVFLMLADLAARTILSPLELPIGVVTSLVGAVVFVIIFYRTRKGV